MTIAKKKILIISMTAGFGHLKAGEALLDYAKENLPDVDAEHIDVSDINPFFKNVTLKIYDMMSKKLPFLWGLLYSVTDFQPVSLMTKKLASIGWFFDGKISNYIYQKNPDAIIFTNIVVLPILAKVLDKKLVNIKIGVVVTDYHGHAYYNFSRIDYYFVGNAGVGKDLENAGVAKEKIIVTGVPINSRFYIKENIHDVKLKYGIDSDFPVVLFIASFKISKHKLVAIIGQLLALKPKITVVCIANGNQEFYDIIQSSFLARQNLLLVKWTDAMEEYMKISDVVITKAGGLTVSECLTLKKTMIIINPIPGQEEHNAEFVEKNNLGIRVKKIDQIIRVLPKMISFSKQNQMALLPQENPCKKIFQYLL